MTNTTANNEENNTSYQNILNKYAEAVENNPTPDVLKENVEVAPIEPESITPDVLKEIQSESVAPPIPVSPAPPEENTVIPAELPPPPIVENNILPPPEPPIVSPIIPSTGSNIFKYIFFVSLVIFLSVVGIIAYSLLKPQNNNNPIVVNPTPTISENTGANQFCQLNDKSYTVGESFKSADDCNTCSCQEDLSIVCTELACASTPTIKITPTPKSSTSSASKTPTKAPSTSSGILK